MNKAQELEKIILDTCEKELNKNIGFMLTKKEAGMFALSISDWMDKEGWVDADTIAKVENERTNAKEEGMREWKYKPCKKCIPLNQPPLIVSGRGYTEYEIRFCQKCGRVIGTITKDYEDIYSKEQSDEKNK
jgi:hypothetical protein